MEYKKYFQENKKDSYCRADLVVFLLMGQMSMGTHHNEEFFPEPEVFRPERFLKENANSIIPFTFRPFGAGPRVCIAQRFAMNEMKICMARLLSKFRLESTPETKLELEKGSFFLINFKDIKIKFVPRN